MALIVDHRRLVAEYPTCYACDEPKVSQEHVPPRCFFPEERDAKGHAIYRTNLITVPSCELHNMRKSDDDFYAAFHLASTTRGNHCAEMVRDGAIARTLERDQREMGGALTKTIWNQIKGRIGDNYYGELDPKRIVPFLELCARGLYFYEKLKPLKMPLNVANVDFDLPDVEKSKLLESQRRSFNEEMRGCKFRGSNPDVFRYAICEKPEKDVVIVEMVFFGELQRWAFYGPGAERQIL